MAQRAGNRGVLSSQRETRRGVVEFSSSPRGNGMARCALRSRGGKTRGDVIGDIPANGSGALERSRVAAVAVRGIQRVIVVGMAGSARRRKMRAYQGKPRDAVVERCSVPTGGGVAVRAIPRRERCAGSGVHRVVGSLPGGQMALRISAAIHGNL